MKKRQKPVLLVTLLVLLVGGAVAMNMAGNPGAPKGEHADEHEEEQPLGKAREQDHSKLGDSAAATLGARPEPAPRKVKGGAASGPGLVQGKPKIYKPVPNDSMTSAQWYTGEHGVKPKKGESSSEEVVGPG